jgi:hypothetical protein
MCAQLVSDFGISVTRVNNCSPARKKDEYANADAEKWFAFRRLLEKREVILPVDGGAFETALKPAAAVRRESQDSIGA